MRGRVSLAAGLFPQCPFLNVIMIMMMMTVAFPMSISQRRRHYIDDIVEGIRCGVIVLTIVTRIMMTKHPSHSNELKQAFIMRP